MCEQARANASEVGNWELKANKTISLSSDTVH